LIIIFTFHIRIVTAPLTDVKLWGRAPGLLIRQAIEGVAAASGAVYTACRS
jgi:hypothetical protein